MHKYKCGSRTRKNVSYQEQKIPSFGNSTVLLRINCVAMFFSKVNHYGCYANRMSESKQWLTAAATSKSGWGITAKYLSQLDSRQWISHLFPFLLKLRKLVFARARHASSNLGEKKIHRIPMWSYLNKPCFLTLPFCLFYLVKYMEFWFPVGANRVRSPLPRGHALTKPPVTQARAKKDVQRTDLRAFAPSPLTEMAASPPLRVPLELSCFI